MSNRTIAIVGAGPIGLELALRARRDGHEVRVYEAGRVAEHFARYGSVRLFTPFGMNATELGRIRLRETGVKLPAEDAILTAEELRERYLVPLSKLPELEGVIREGWAVTGIARAGITKHRSTALRAERPRAERPRAELPFLVGIAGRLDRADVVVDASGVYETPNATGPGGMPAMGEEAAGSIGGEAEGSEGSDGAEGAGSWMERRLPAISGSARARYAGKRILLIGDGASAATALVDLDEMIRAGGDAAGTRVDWVHRDRPESLFKTVPAVEIEQLPALRELLDRANRVAREAPWIRRHPGAAIAAYQPRTMRPRMAVDVTLEEREGERTKIQVDQVLALVGYRPDLSLFRELQVHLCYASEGPMALAAAMAASKGDASSAEGCLGQVSYGPDSLKNPEPGFYILGAKSYGRNPNFILSIGHKQIEDVMSLIGAAEPRLTSTPG